MAVTLPDDVVHVLLRWTAEDFHAHGEDAGPGAARMTEVQHAGVLDFAERLSAEFGGRVIIAARGAPEVGAATGKRMETVWEDAGSPVIRARRIVEHTSRAGGGVPILLWVAPDPLYRIEDIRRATELLTCDDELLPMAGRRGVPEEIAFVASRSFHPAVFSGDGPGSMLSLRALMLSDAAPVPLRSAGPCCSLEDLPGYLHDIEREMLLDRWFPHRTYQLVRRLLPCREAL